MTIRLRSDFPETLSFGLRQSTKSFGLTKAFGTRSTATGKEEFGRTMSAFDSARARLSHRVADDEMQRTDHRRGIKTWKLLLSF